VALLIGRVIFMIPLTLITSNAEIVNRSAYSHGFSNAANYQKNMLDSSVEITSL
jgi:hypothetical protein